MEALAMVAGFGVFAACIIKIMSEALSIRKLALESRRKNVRRVLEISVDHSVYTINVSDIDREDPRKLDSAIKAVKDARMCA